MRVGGKEPGSNATRGDFSYFIEHHLAAGVRLVTDWPRGIHSLVEEIARVNPTQSAQRSAGFFGRYLGPWCSETALRALMKSEVPLVLAKMDLAVKASSYSRLNINRRDNVVTRTEAMTALGIPVKTLWRLDGAGQAFIRKCDHRTGARLFDAAKLKRSFDTYRGAATTEDVAAALGLPTFVAPALADAGLVSRITDHDAVIMAGSRHLYDFASVEILRARLLAVGNTLQVSGVSIWKALEREFSPIAWSRTVSAILGGDLDASVTDPTAPPGEALRVRPAAVRDYRRKLGRLIVPEGNVCGKEAAKLLGANHVFVSEAVNAGVFQLSEPGRRFKIALRTLADFNAKYVLHSEVATRIGQSDSATKLWLSRSGVTPIRVCPKARIGRAKASNR